MGRVIEKLPIFPSANLDTIEKELMHSAKGHHTLNKQHYIMKLLGQPESSDNAGIQDSQSYNPESTITFDTTGSDITGKQDSQSSLLEPLFNKM